MSIHFAAKSDVGKIRKNNEDSFLTDEELELFIVADGMGGHNSGEIASKMATEVIHSNFRRARDLDKDLDRTRVILGSNKPGLLDNTNQLVSSVRLANQVIFESARTYPQHQGMGTTVVALSVKASIYSFAWVGDSRIYLVRDNKIEQLSNDHSLVQEQIDKGLMTTEQAEQSEYKNVLTRALGNLSTVEVDAAELPMEDDDYLLLCSDGLSRMLTDAQILQAVLSNKDPQSVCDTLIASANNAGGRDNITVAAIYNKTETIWQKFLKNVAKAT